MEFTDEVKAEALDVVRTSLRITTTRLYDPELKIYIEQVVSDLEHLGVTNDALSLSDFQGSCVAYAKSLFGTGDVSDKNLWKAIYDKQLLKFKLRGDADGEKVG